MLSEFYINDLFEERNVRIPFESPYKILVAENGYGKTTILNAIYALMSGDISKLRKIQFSTIGVRFNSGQSFNFNKSEFDTDLEHIRSHHFFQHLEPLLGEDFIIRMIDEARGIPRHRLESSPLFRLAKNKSELPASILLEYLREMASARNHRRLNSKTQDKIDNIKRIFGLQSLYLPTYRRVEEDIRVLAGPSVNELSDTLHSINFGMSDVKKSIEVITSEILISSVEWFSKINGQMLSQLVNGVSITEDMIQSVSSIKAVKIVLERIGKNISEDHKQQILNLVDSGEILKNHEPLVYFVGNLLKVYEQQQENDTAIQQFTTVSNKYLTDKKVVYDESKVTIEIIRKKNGKNVDIESLSSGEKQIVSLFALLYLQNKTNLAIFFDEPELSLSMEWQRTLLPDIINSGKCKFLFSTTHSPFIFDNEFEGNTVDLSAYIQES